MENKVIQKSLTVLVSLIAVFMVIMVVVAGACHKNTTTTWGSSVVKAPSHLTITNTAGTLLATWQDNSNNETSFCLYDRAYDTSEWVLYSEDIPADATTFSFAASTLSSPHGNFQLCLTAYDSSTGVESKATDIVSISW